MQDIEDGAKLRSENPCQMIQDVVERLVIHLSDKYVVDSKAVC